jgi:triosephosphate isomerase
MTTRIPFVGGNWKMNTDLSGAIELAGAVGTRVGSNSPVEIACYVPFPYLLVARDALGSVVRLGAQDLWTEDNGAFTGEVSSDMLRDCGVTTVLTGHSERRHVIGESDELVGAKTRRALSAGLQAVLCIGETIEERDAGQTDSVNERQTRAGLEGVSAADLKNVVIAYEPVWAIGTGKTATPEDAQDAHRKIRTLIGTMYDERAADSIRIIYGGSMKPGNAAELMSMDDIDGGLIGGASLKADDFGAIIDAAMSRV